MVTTIGKYATDNFRSYTPDIRYYPPLVEQEFIIQYSDGTTCTVWEYV